MALILSPYRNKDRNLLTPSQRPIWADTSTSMIKIRSIIFLMFSDLNSSSHCELFVRDHDRNFFYFVVYASLFFVENMIKGLENRKQTLPDFGAGSFLQYQFVISSGSFSIFFAMKFLSTKHICFKSTPFYWIPDICRWGEHVTIWAKNLLRGMLSQLLSKTSPILLVFLVVLEPVSVDEHRSLSYILKTMDCSLSQWIKPSGTRGLVEAQSVSSLDR